MAADDTKPDRYSNEAWRASLPKPLSQAEQEAAIQHTKEHTDKVRESAKKSDLAKKIYADMYERDPTTWKILTFDEKYNEVVKRLMEKNLTLTEVELVIIKTTLKNSTIKVKFIVDQSVDEEGGPDP